MSVFSSDTFTGASGTLLLAHTPDVGGSWTKAAGTTIQIDNANRVRCNATGEGDYFCNGTPASADYDVQADITPLTLVTGSYGGVIGRCDSSAGGTAAGCYFGFYDNETGTQRWTVQKGVSNVFTNVATAAATLTAATTYTTKLQMRGTALTLFVNGVSTIATTDSAVTAVGKAGIMLDNSGTPSDTTDFHLDNFSGSDPVAAGSSFPPIPAVWHNPLIPM